MKCSKKIILLLVFLMVSIVTTGCAGNNKNEVMAEKDQKVGEGKYSFKLGHILTIDHPIGQGAIKFAELVKEKTNGHVIIDVFPSSQLGNEKDIFDAVAMGIIDFSILGFGEPAKRFSPALILDAPFIAEDRQHLVRIFDDEIVQDLFKQMEEETNVCAIGPFYSGTRYLTTSNKLVKSPDDMEGLKIRTPDQPIFVSTIKAMGATPVPMAFPEVYLSLQQGVIDGEENAPATIITNKFYEVQKYIIKTAHVVCGNCIYVSKKTLDKLPEEYQNAVIEAGKEAADYISKISFEKEDEYLKELEEMDNVTIIEDVDRDAFIDNIQDLYKEYESKWGEGLLEKIRTIE